MNKKIKKTNQPLGLFDEAIRLNKLSAKGDPLDKLKKIIPWEDFRPIIEKVLVKEPKGLGGRPPYDNILKFKILVLQKYYNISDEQIEYQINDRLTFMRFLDLSISDDVPDQNTIWNFRETLTKNNLIEKLFNKFNDILEKSGYIGSEGRIIDASFVEAPRQRNSKDENDDIKNGKVPDDWNKDKLNHKDVDAKWTKKNGQTYYGYKDHVKVDKKSKLILKYKVTDASVHDSQALKDLLDKKDKKKTLYGDSAYSGEENVDIIEKKKMRNKVHEKGYRNKPLSESQIKRNNEKSKIRVRVEHVFGYIEKSMHGSTVRTVGIKRAETVIGLMNLTYNLFRFMFLAKA